MKLRLSRCLYRMVGFALFLASACSLRATPDLRFDVAWFCCPCYPTNHLCEPQFDHLNIPSTNGHFMAMSTDEHRSTINSNGNVIAMLYNTFDDGAWTNVGYTGAQEAAAIDQWAKSNFTNTGPLPDWLILNEISSGTWPSSQSYRTYVTDTAHALVNIYGYKLIVYAPFSNPGANSSDWKTLSSNAYIAVENYLSGLEIKNQNFSVSWCQSQYQSSITSYGNLGVAKSRLMLGEHFGQTTNSSWGREGVSSNDWISAITVRSQAAANIGFPGYLTYAWYSDAMQVPDAELLTDEDTYAAISLPTNNPLTVPYIITQPQSQTLPAGATAMFDIVMAGDAALTYQWKRNGANISGATTNPLVITNISGANNGVYSVVISNAVGFTNSAGAALVEAVTPPFASDPFAPGTTSYTVGSNLVGQTNAAGLSWAAAGPTGANTIIASGNLTVPGLAAPTGNSISFGVATGPCDRFGFPNNFTTGTVYYSYAFRVDDLGSLGTGGFFAAFNNSTGPQSGNPTVVGAATQTRLSGSGFNVGLKGAVGGSVFDTNVYNVGQTVFVVGSYTFNSGSSTDDVANLWINPDRSTFGSAIQPSPTLTTTSGGDISSGTIASFVFFRRGSGNGNLQPAAMTADELRIGTNWASVTPPLTILFIPTLTATVAGGNVILSWSTNAVGFDLYSTPAFSSSSNTWSAVTTPVTIVGTNYVVTNSLAGGNRLYRLSDP